MKQWTICILLLYTLFERVIDATKCSQMPIIDDPYKQLLSDEKSVESMCGTYRPFNCEYDEKIAILVPYRNREIQLRILVNYLTQFLINYRKYFAIFVLEPLDGQIFNRGKLFNVGFEVANTLDVWDCFFFHDVDLLPTNRSIPYKCPNKGTAQHWSTSVDKFDFKLPYSAYFGGVSAMNADEFIAVNGYPNAFWGWGGEDDCFEYRVANSNISIVRALNGSTKYTMLRHGQNEKGNEVNPCRNEILSDWKKLWHFDGLNTLNYEIVSINMYNLYYHLIIDLKPPNNTCEKTKYNINNENATYPVYNKPSNISSFPLVHHCGFGIQLLLYTMPMLSTETLAIFMIILSALSMIVIIVFKFRLKRCLLSPLSRRMELNASLTPLI